MNGLDVLLTLILALLALCTGVLAYVIYAADLKEARDAASSSNKG